MSKIVLIIDKSKPYLDFQKKIFSEKWGENNVEEVDDFSKVGIETLFGDVSCATIFVENTKKMKELVAQIEQSIKKGDFEKKIKNGLIIRTTLPRISTKKIEKIVTEQSGENVFIKENSKDKTNPVEKIISESNLNNTVKTFLKNYIGDDYENLISIMRSINVLSDKQQSKLSVEDIYIRLPQKPGSIPPWEIEKPLFNGNTNETIKTYRRITDHTHFLVILSFLKNKINLMWKIRSIMDVEYDKSRPHIAKALNTPNTYPFGLAYNKAQQLPLDVLTKIMYEILVTESKVKGGSKADSKIIMEVLLIKISQLLKK